LQLAILYLNSANQHISDTRHQKAQFKCKTCNQRFHTKNSANQHIDFSKGVILIYIQYLPIEYMRTDLDFTVNDRSRTAQRLY
jgi:transposase-like protein